MNTKDKKTCTIYQPAGLGDIFYLQKVAHHYREMGYKIKWPVIPEYLWLSNYVSDIDFYETQGMPFSDFKKAETYHEDGSIWINTSIAHMIHDGPIMSSRYELFGLDGSNWYNYLKFDRIKKKEDELYYDVIGLKEDHEYTLRSRFTDSPPYNTDNHLDVSYDLDVVDLCFIEGYTLLDWCKVIEKAKRIHTINTSVNFVIEVLDLTCEEYVIYAKDKENLKEIEYLFKKQDRYECI